MPNVKYYIIYVLVGKMTPDRLSENSANIKFKLYDINSSVENL